MMAAPMPQSHAGSGRWGRALGREQLDDMLLQAAQSAGAAVWQPYKASALCHTEHNYECTVSAADDTRVLTAPIVIAAHGSWENGTLPTQASTPHAASDLLAFKAHFLDCDLPADLMPLLAFPGGYGGMVHSDGGRVSLTCCIRRDTLDQCRAHGGHRRAAEAVLHHIQSSCAGVRHALKRATLDHAWLSAGPIRPGIRDCYADGIFRIGNCAGEAHPVVAEGISMAMQSAALLCRLLIAGECDAELGRGVAEVGARYESEWKDLFAPRIRAASVFAHLAMSPVAAEVVLPFMKHFPQVLTIGAHLSGKVRLSSSCACP
jgi:flavin-dependent dehydrogenase